MNEDYLSDFLVYLELDLNYSSNTIKTYETAIEKFIKYIGNKNILKVDYVLIEKYL